MMSLRKMDLLFCGRKRLFCGGEESGAYQGGEFKEGRTIFGESSEAFKNMRVNKR